MINASAFGLKPVDLEHWLSVHIPEVIERNRQVLLSLDLDTAAEEFKKVLANPRKPFSVQPKQHHLRQRHNDSRAVTNCDRTDCSSQSSASASSYEPSSGSSGMDDTDPLGLDTCDPAVVKYLEEAGLTTADAVMYAQRRRCGPGPAAGS